MLAHSYQRWRNIKTTSGQGTLSAVCIQPIQQTQYVVQMLF